jgi:hypothetical protein
MGSAHARPETRTGVAGGGVDFSQHGGQGGM